MNAADFCRKEGWTVGTVLRRGPDNYRISWVGIESIVVVGPSGREQSWNDAGTASHLSGPSNEPKGEELEQSMLNEILDRLTKLEADRQSVNEILAMAHDARRDAGIATKAVNDYAVRLGTLEAVLRENQRHTEAKLTALGGRIDAVGTRMDKHHSRINDALDATKKLEDINRESTPTFNSLVDRVQTMERDVAELNPGGSVAADGRKMEPDLSTVEPLCYHVCAESRLPHQDCGAPALPTDHAGPGETAAWLDPDEESEADHDEKAAKRFYEAMRSKLAAQRAKGYGGWHDSKLCPRGKLQGLLIGHLSKGDPLDVAIFAMMIWARGEQVSEPQSVQAALDAEREGIAVAIEVQSNNSTGLCSQAIGPSFARLVRSRIGQPGGAA